MELTDNLLQFSAAFSGAVLSGISYRKSHRQAYFPLHGSPSAGGRPVHGQTASPPFPVLHRRDGGVPALGLHQHLPRIGVSGGCPCRHGGDRAGGGGGHEAAAAGVLSSGI